MSILITGGFGFLGGRLAQVLAEHNSNEIILGSRTESKAPIWLPTAKVRLISWKSESSILRSCRNISTLVHLAALNAEDCSRNPIDALAFNGLTTARLLSAAIQAKVKRFIYLSTIHVYKKPLKGLISEKTCVQALDPYATSHRAGEDCVRLAHQEKRIDGIVLRLSNAFGAPAHQHTNCWQLLLNDLCRQAVYYQKIVLRSSGLQRRDFIPLSDACAAVVHCINLPSSQIGDGLFNISGDWAPTVFEIACLVRDRCRVVLGYAPELIRVEPENGETSDYLEYSWEPLRKSGFQPKFERIKEIDCLIEYCRKEML